MQSSNFKHIYILVTGIVYIFFLFIDCSQAPFSQTSKIKDSYFNGNIQIQKIEKLGKYCLSVHNLKTGGKDRIYTPYEVFTMETGDINHDGRTDICLGIIKPTPFDSVLKKRLFIFQIDNDYVRPLWLSSRLVRPLVSFKVVTKNDSSCKILVIEREDKKRYCVSEYRWGSFGMNWMKSHGTSLSLNKAKKLTEINIKSYE